MKRPEKPRWAKQPGCDGGTIGSSSYTIKVLENEFRHVLRRLRDARVETFSDMPLWLHNDYWSYIVQDPMGVTIEVYMKPNEKPESRVSQVWLIPLVSYDRPFLSSKRLGVHVNLVEREDYPLFETIGQPYAMFLVSKMLELTANPGLDVIHVHYAIPHVLSVHAVSQISGLPWLVTLHGFDAHSPGWNPSFRQAMLRTLQDADAVTTVSEFQRGGYKKG